MAYPEMNDHRETLERIGYWTQLKYEHGAGKEVRAILRRLDREIHATVRDLKKLPIDKTLAEKEPNDLARIRALRPAGPRRLWQRVDMDRYREKLEGALLARMAGCILGALVEGQSIDRMEQYAQSIGDPFPPRDYWKKAENPKGQRYWRSYCEEFTRSKMNGVPVDDDIAYTLLGLLVVEDHGPDFTTANLAESWLKYLPFGCTAEGVALANLRKKVPIGRVGEKDNPFSEWIGADIRSDPWAYMAPGWPEQAADMAYRDAYISHRRNGIYGEMFFSAAIAAAFDVDDPVEALKIGLTEIPRDCSLAKAARWALKEAPGITDYKEARAAVDERFGGMHPVHTINNACLTIWGLTIGGSDVTRVLGETVAMGLDNDCTAATAGSLIGAIVGKKGIPKHWYRNFNDTVHSYLNDKSEFAISDLLDRFARQAELISRQ